MVSSLHDDNQYADIMSVVSMAVYHRTTVIDKFYELPSKLFGILEGDGFGKNLAMNGNGFVLEVAAPQIDYEGFESGSVHLFGQSFISDRFVEFKRVDGMCGDQYLGCLLYTSPSPRDRTRSRMPSSA